MRKQRPDYLSIKGYNPILQEEILGPVKVKDGLFIGDHLAAKVFYNELKQKRILNL